MDRLITLRLPPTRKTDTLLSSVAYAPTLVSDDEEKTTVFYDNFRDVLQGRS